jgi:xylulokinase
MALLGLDVGTSACKGIALSEDGRELAYAGREYKLSFPGKGRVELDPESVWQAVQDVIRMLAYATEQKHDPIRAFSFSVSGDEAIPVDARGAALYPCIMAMDVRSIDIAGWWEREIGRERIYGITGLPIHAMHPINRLMWLRSHEPQIFVRTTKMLCWEEFLALRLGIEPVTDYSIASRTMAFHIGEHHWSSELLDAAHLPEGLFSEVQPSGKAIGTIPHQIAQDLGLRKSVTLVTGGFDQAMAALGSGLLNPGEAGVGTGTWEALTIVTETPILSPTMLEAGYPFGCYVAHDLYFCLASNAGGGSLLRWYRDTLGEREVEQSLVTNVDVFDLIVHQASARPTGLLMLPHFEGSYNPWMDPHSTGIFVGLRLNTTRGDLVKAILEGVTFELRENIERVEQAGLAIKELRATGGGAKSAIWLQLKADITGKPITTLNIKETGCFAAACLAGVGIGAFLSIEEPIKNFVQTTSRFVPRSDHKAEYDEIFEAYHALYTTIKPINRLLVKARSFTAEERTL